MRFPANAEWLEADGHGGFASGTVSGIRTRRYHALLLVATTPPTGRMVLVNGFDAWVTTPSGTFALTSQRYAPGIIHPDGLQRLVSFQPDPWPRWTHRLEDGTILEQEIFIPHGTNSVVVTWRLAEPAEGITLAVRPLISGRDYHALHHENASFRFEAAREGERVTWRPYPGVPAIVASSNATYTAEPDWYRNFQYDEERDRGLDFTEDLAAPGILAWDLSRGEGVLILSTGEDADAIGARDSALTRVERWRDAERRRRGAVTRLERSASAYVVGRGGGKTIIAGYPWFTDWGRDTFISMRGLCLATGALDVARDILVQWASTVSEGMLPNRLRAVRTHRR